MLIKAQTSIGLAARYLLNRGDDIIVGQNVTLVSTDGIAIASGGVAGGHNVTIAGTVRGSDAGLVIGSTSVDPASQVRITASGIVASDDVAVVLQGESLTFENEGLVTGNRGVFLTSSGAVRFENGGTVVGLENAVLAWTGITLINTGRITGGAYAFAGFNIDSAQDRLINRGQITGTIDLSGGNDLYDGRGGRVRGHILGGDGDDRFIVGAAAETIYGQNGYDLLDFRPLGAVYVDLDNAGANRGAAKGDIYLGVEILWGSERGDDTLIGDDASHVFNGHGGDDRIIGGAEMDDLRGGTGRDRLSGKDGSDHLYGGAGVDSLNGGGGADYFFFNSRSETGDQITDFDGGKGAPDNQNDYLIFNFKAFGLTGRWNDDWFRSGPGNQAQDRNDHFIFRSSDTTLWFDPDGKGGQGPSLILDLQAGARLYAYNFDPAT